MIVDLIKKNILMGLGLASMTQSKLKEIGKKIAEEGKLSQEEGEKLVSEILKQADEAKDGLQKQIHEMIEKAMHKFKPPCLCEIEKLKKEIHALREEIHKNSGN
ncbi:MAG: hypothetical protein A2020_10375 [Lentisphaerae bacterium GWF2_45_14]|nr:MAG: hypothetical protein A2020_10375 [Lentisphaerae bacterium GWF2_45_14]